MSGSTTPDEPCDEIPDELAEQLGFESARRQWLKEAALRGDLDTPELDELAPDIEREPDNGPEIEP